tara:strand:+ start:4960 stop:5403 length:444 start_codon:yes stop_codon:yes gene_type:complete
MKKRYAKIDRSTGDVIKRKEFDDPNRVLNKPFVWLEEQRDPEPAYNKETHKLVGTVTQPDLSDLQVDVSSNVKRVFGFDTVALTAQEIDTRRDEKIDRTNDKMVRVVELILTKIATKNGVALEKSDFPAKVWTAINNRRALRGESPV